MVKHICTSQMFIMYHINIVEKVKSERDMRNKIKRYIGTIIICCTVIICSTSFGDTIYAATGINVETHSQEEIKAVINNINYDVCEYGAKPKLKAPYSPGSLSDDTLVQANKTINAIRYVAGIPYDVTLNDDYNKMAQAASLVDYVNNTLTHHPDKPVGMSRELYELGYKGASSSNLSWVSSGKSSPQKRLIKGWMNDGAIKNIASVGHRRWILNPSMKQTGFGAVWGTNGIYLAMYAFDGCFEDTDYYGVAWPAQNMPLVYFDTDYPWSISMGYEVTDDAVVTLTRMRDGKVWRFANDSEDFYINNQYYGRPGCIIFRPNDIDEYLEGDTFNVMITGTNVSVNYDVSFFSGVPVTSIKLNRNTLELIEKEDDEAYLEATVYPANTDSTISWKSSNEKIVKVDDEGCVLAVSPGTAIIRCENADGTVYDECKVTVKTNLKRPTIKKIKTSKKTITFNWNKISGAKGYQIRYSQKSNMKNSKSYFTSKTNSVIKKLKTNKTYYVQVRAYKTNYKGKKIYGNWSSRKKISTKK